MIFYETVSSVNAYSIGGREVFFNVEETRYCSIWRMGRFKDTRCLLQHF